MYNRYIPNTGQSQPKSESGPESQPWAEGLFGAGQRLFSQMSHSFDLLGETASGGILNRLGLESVDSGDVLLMLILLLVFLEGDNTELVITLGLMLLLGGEGHQTE